MNIELVIFDMAGTTVNDDDGVNRSVRAALDHVGIAVTREAVNAVMGIPKPVALATLDRIARSIPSGWAISMRFMTTSSAA